MPDMSRGKFLKSSGEGGFVTNVDGLPIWVVRKDFWGANIKIDNGFNIFQGPLHRSHPNEARTPGDTKTDEIHEQ